MINRRETLGRHNPVLTTINKESPLTVGNGDFAFTADITGFQTLGNEYDIVPLCTMSNWGWHTKPDDGRYYSRGEIKMTEYDYNGRKVYYPSEIVEGNGKFYNWFRQNPHRLNLARISLLWNNTEVKSEDITDIKQTLDLYSGVIKSEYKLFGYHVNVETICGQSRDILGFSVKSEGAEKLSVMLSFPYGSHKITASDWENESHNISGETRDSCFVIKHSLDRDEYYVAISGAKRIENKGRFSYVIKDGITSFTVEFSKKAEFSAHSFADVKSDSEKGWVDFWESGGAVDFSKSTDKRAHELERRTILSQYQIAINSAGSIPPQETGLVCNSWYGKFHLEMHLLHSGWLPLWGRGELLEKSLKWYESILENALTNASFNGYKGARWVKMTGPEGLDSPSMIAVLLIWQQPHIIHMCELIKNSKKGQARTEFMRRYYRLVELTAVFMADFAVLNEETGYYDLLPPLIPAQEEHNPRDVKNPAFELCYWRYGLKTAATWADELDICTEQTKIWKSVGSKMAIPAIHDGLYSAHENCPDTFEKFNRDHPSMLFCYGFLEGDEIDAEVMNRTTDKVLASWDFETCWGWDFALMAMTLAKLGRREEAIDVLLMDTVKNSYVESGNNYQRSRTDLPLYLPGNGSLLFALAYILNLGFPDNGKWDIETEKIKSPY